MDGNDEGKAPAPGPRPTSARPTMAGSPASSASSSSSASAASAMSSTPGGPPGQNAAFVGAAPEYVPLIDELKRAYKNKILPLEQAFKFEEFHSNSLTDTDFDAKPMVLLIGQYSTGSKKSKKKNRNMN